MAGGNYYFKYYAAGGADYTTKKPIDVHIYQADKKAPGIDPAGAELVPKTGGGYDTLSVKVFDYTTTENITVATIHKNLADNTKQIFMPCKTSRTTKLTQKAQGSNKIAIFPMN